MKGKKPAAAKSECVKVAIRVRPMNKHEKEQNSTICVDVDTGNNSVAVTSNKNDTKTFQFDYVYPMDTTQREIYDQVAFPIVDSIFQGYNGTIFAYGQTGCGKTYTMMGVVDNPELKGIIPNAFSHIFGFIKTEGESKKFLVRCSFVEIYNEEVRDLLVNNNQKLAIKEDPKKGTFVKDLTYVTLKDTEDIQKCLDRGNKNRHVGATSMNDQSSRSHSLFTVYLEIEENGKIRSGKLNLVDLAGSERVGKTNATGQTFDEGKKINLSLTALGSVIDALSFNKKYIPYKDSKLTRLLADSLGGNTKTVMFANISPASYNYDETVGTLRYASRAKLIKNAPKVNEDPKDALLRKYEEEIKKLKEQLENGGGNAPQKVIKKVKKKKKPKKENENENNNNNGDDNDEDDNESDDDNGEKYDDFALIMDDPEKKSLREKLAALEKNLLDNKKLEISEQNAAGDKEEIKKKMQEQEEENRKFKEYREQQLKQSEEMELKLRKLEEEKRKEEENLKNDVSKLQQKIKELNSEIKDLKLDNTKDRTDYMEGVKAIYRNNQFYREILKYMLSDEELQKIRDLSKYIEDEDKWNVQSFTLQEKSLALPTVKLGQLGGGFGNNRITDLKKNGGNKQIIFQNYDNDNNNNYEDEDENNNQNNYENKKLQKDIDLKVSKSSKKIKEINRYENQLNNNRINFRLSKDKIVVDGKRQAKSQVPVMRNNAGTQKAFYNKIIAPSIDETNNINKILMNEKERKKFEGLSNGGNGNLLNPMYVSASNPSQYFSKGNKHGKIMLNPLGNGNGNKFESSMKNNMDSKNIMPPIFGNKKIKLAQIQEKREYD
jgi:kinesin family protein 3/17